MKVKNVMILVVFGVGFGLSVSNAFSAPDDRSCANLKRECQQNPESNACNLVTTFCGCDLEEPELCL